MKKKLSLNFNDGSKPLNKGFHDDVMNCIDKKRFTLNNKDYYFTFYFSSDLTQTEKELLNLMMNLDLNNIIFNDDYSIDDSIKRTVTFSIKSLCEEFIKKFNAFVSYSILLKTIVKLTKDGMIDGVGDNSNVGDNSTRLNIEKLKDVYLLRKFSYVRK